MVAKRSRGSSTRKNRLINILKHYNVLPSAYAPAAIRNYAKLITKVLIYADKILSRARGA